MLVSYKWIPRHVTHTTRLSLINNTLRPQHRPRVVKQPARTQALFSTHMRWSDSTEASQSARRYTHTRVSKSATTPPNKVNKQHKR